MKIELSVSTPHQRIIVVNDGEILNFVINKEAEIYHAKNSSFNKRTEYIKQYKGWYVGNLSFVEVMRTAELLDENVCDLFIIGYEYNYWGEKMRFTEKLGVFFKDQYYESDGVKKRIPKEVKQFIEKR